MGLPSILVVTPEISSLHISCPLGCDEEASLSWVPSSHGRTLKARGADMWRAKELESSPDARSVRSGLVLITFRPCSPTRSGPALRQLWGTLALNFCCGEGKKTPLPAHFLSALGGTVVNCVPVALQFHSCQGA